MIKEADPLDISRKKKTMKVLLEGVDNEIKNINITKSSSCHDILILINTQLYRLSILMSYYIYLSTVAKKNIASQECDAMIYDLDKLFKLQLERATHKQVILNNTEIKENFSYWKGLPSAVLMRILKKENYLLHTIQDYFTIESKLLSSFVSLLIKFAQTSTNFINIEVYSTPDKDSRKDFSIIEELINFTIEIQQWAQTKCLELWVVDKNISWGAKALQLMALSRVLYKLQKQEQQALEITEKIELLQKRLNTETKSDGPIKKEVSNMSLEELLSYN